MSPLRGGDAPQLSGKRVLETTPSGLRAEGAEGGSSPRQGRPLRDQRSQRSGPWPKSSEDSATAENVQWGAVPRRGCERPPEEQSGEQGGEASAQGRWTTATPQWQARLQGAGSRRVGPQRRPLSEETRWTRPRSEWAGARLRGLVHRVLCRRGGGGARQDGGATPAQRPCASSSHCALGGHARRLMTGPLGPCPLLARARV